jgi:hypothetical protein
MRYTSKAIHALCRALNAEHGILATSEEGIMLAQGFTVERDSTGWRVCRYTGSRYGVRDMHPIRLTAAACAQVLIALSNSSRESR